MLEEVEILAPAGDEESFYSAINNGANAIYLGLKNFNARNKAENFSLDNLRQFVYVAHLLNVKIYVVINTLVTTEELDDLLHLVEGAISAKVDAFIVQDIGVAKLLISTFKGIILHASTQMGICSLQGAKIAEELGFKRVVLSREVTKQDIINIKQNTNLEIEYFVHGALCVCFSGNCYLSSLNSNESGNRGRCLQPCRLLYSSQNNKKNIKNGYLLSATDLCLIDKIKELKECGVTSFKIEGRLRRPSYVAYSVKSYSEANKTCNTDSNFNGFLRVQNFKKLFNRGDYNTGFYLGGETNKNIINTAYQNHRGIKIGVVKRVKSFKDIYEILVFTNGYEVKKNDGLKFIIDGQEKSIGVGNVDKTPNKNEYIVYSKTKPKINSEVYLTVDSEWERSLLNVHKKIAFDAEFTGLINEKAKLKLCVGEVEVNCQSNEVLLVAQNQALTQEEVETNLQKTKDTFFELGKLTCKLQNVFMAKSLLNELRREALDMLQKKLVENYESKNIKQVNADFSFYNKLFKNANNNRNFLSKNASIILDNSKNNEQEETENLIENSSNFFKSKDINNEDSNLQKTEQISNFVCFNEDTSFNEIEKYFANNSFLVFSPNNYTINNVKQYVEKVKLKLNVNKVYLNLPKVLRSDDFEIVNQIVTSFSKEELGLVANNIGHLYFSHLGYEIIGGVYLNITNISSIQALKVFNIKTFVKSFEKFASSLDSGLMYIGSPAVMTFCHCPYKTNYGNISCSECKFNNNLTYVAQDKKEYKIRRVKIKNCIFELVNNSKINFDVIKFKPYFLDLRS